MSRARSPEQEVRRLRRRVAAGTTIVPHAGLPPFPSSKSEVCIAGVSCRFPRCGDSLEKFWDLVQKNADCTVEIPKSRVNLDVRAKLPKRAALIDDATSPDMATFGWTKAEAECTDPQQFLLQEGGLSAMENAGYPKELFSGSPIAVYVGAMNRDYQAMVQESEIHSSFAAGSANSMLAARVSYDLDFRGPSCTLDTACSSALVAMHTCINTLQVGQANIALCQGVNLLLNVKVWLALQEAGMISDRSKPFSKDADGYGRGEGCGSVVLRRLGEQDRSSLQLASIVGSAVCSNGQSVRPITRPASGPQALCMRTAWGDQVDKCQYVEAHNTGTKTGDPVEGESIAKVFGREECDVSVGAAKANFNHLESAAGMVGLIKTVLCLKMATLPPFGGPLWKPWRSSFDFVEKGLRAPNQEQMSMPKGPSYAGVNSFGFGGQNAHVALRLDSSEEHTPARGDGPFVAVFSSTSRKAMETELNRIAIYLSTLSEEETKSACQALALHRSHVRSGSDAKHRIDHKFRCAVVAGSRDDLVRKMQSQPEIGTAQGAPSVIFAFCGNGALRRGMAKPLMAFPVFREALTQLASKDSFPKDFNVVKWCAEDAEVPRDVCHCQVLLFAFQLALAKLLEACGISPRHVLVHSAGEIAGACISGDLTVDSALEVVVVRGTLLRRVACGGGPCMLAVNMSMSEWDALRPEARCGLEVAAENSETWLSLAGKPEGICKFHESKVAWTVLVEVDVPFHSSAMEPIREDLERNLSGKLRSSKGTPSPKLFSSVEGKCASPERLTQVDHWSKSTRHMVKFREACDACFRDLAESSPESPKSAIIIEIAPRAPLKTHILSTAEAHLEEKVLVLQGVNVAETCVALWQRGCELDWSRVFDPTSTTKGLARLFLPNRAFDRDSKIWKDPQRNQHMRHFGTTQASQQQAQQHPYPGYIKVLERSTAKVLSTLTIGRESTPLVFQHKLREKPLVPGAVFADAVARISGHSSSKPRLIEIEFKELCFVEESADTLELQLCFTEHGRFTITHRASRQLFASGCALPDVQEVIGQLTPQLLSMAPGLDEDGRIVYEKLKKMGLEYGELLAGLSTFKWDAALKVATARLDLHDEHMPRVAMHAVHPALLDMWLQMMAIPLHKMEPYCNDGQLRALPVGIKGLVVHKPAGVKSMLGLMRVTHQVNDTLVLAGFLATLDGEVVVEIREATAHLTSEKLTQQRAEPFQNCFWNLTLRDLLSLPSSEHLDSEERRARCCFIGDEDHPLRSYLGENTVVSEDCTDIVNLARMSRSIVYAKTSGSQQGVEDPGFYDGLVREIEGLCNLVRALTQANQAPTVWVVTCGTPLVPTDNFANANPAGAAFFGLLKNLVIENVLPGPDGSSMLRAVDVDSFSQENMTVLASEIAAAVPRDDCAEIVIRRGRPQHMGLAENSWSHRELCGAVTASVPLQQQQANFKFHVSDDGNIVAAPAGAPAPGGIHVRVLEVTLHPDSYFRFSSSSGEWPGPAQAPAGSAIPIIDFVCSKQDGRLKFVGCVPIHLSYGMINVEEACLCSRDIIPPGVSLSHLVLAYEVVQVMTREWKMGVEKSLAVRFDHTETAIARAVHAALEALLPSCWPGARLYALSAYQHDACFIVSLGATSSILASRSPCHFEVRAVCASSRLPRPLEERQRFYMLDTANLFQKAYLLGCIPELSKILSDSGVTYQHADIYTFDDINKAWEQRQHGPVRVNMSAVVAPIWRPDGQLFDSMHHYIVTGALRPSNLGFLNAKWLVEQGAHNLVLTGRSEPDGVFKEHVHELTQSNPSATVKCQKIDVCAASGIDALSTFLAKSSTLRIGGVFHAAAVFKDGLFKTQAPENLQAVMAPKIKGSLVMGQCLRDHPVEHFVMHSSLVSVTGNWGQAGYGAANNFLDAFALQRNMLGLPAQSINWPGLEGVGILAGAEGDRKAEQLRQTRGFETLNRAGIVRSLRAVMCLKRPQLAVAKFDFKVVHKSTMWGNPLVRGRFETPASAYGYQGTPTDAASSTGLADLLRLSDTEIREKVFTILCEVLPASADPRSLSEKKSLADMGLESGDAISARQRFRQLGVGVDINDLLNPEFTVAQVTDSIVARVTLNRSYVAV